MISSMHLFAVCSGIVADKAKARRIGSRSIRIEMKSPTTIPLPKVAPIYLPAATAAAGSPTVVPIVPGSGSFLCCPSGASRDRLRASILSHAAITLSTGISWMHLGMPNSAQLYPGQGMQGKSDRTAS